jgi:hypothetical protein
MLHLLAIYNGRPTGYYLNFINFPPYRVITASAYI